MPKNPQVWLLNSRLGLNPNKAGLCEGSFLWGGQFDSPFIFQEELISI